MLRYLEVALSGCFWPKPAVQIHQFSLLEWPLWRKADAQPEYQDFAKSTISARMNGSAFGELIITRCRPVFCTV